MITRIAIGKAIGLVVGTIGMLATPVFFPDVDFLTRIGILLWYPTMGAFVGVFGIFTRHPVLDMPMPWWVRAPLIGAWMNFVLVFFAHQTMSNVLASLTGMNVSPFWFVLEGGLVGGLIGYLATHYGGEGRETLG